MDIFYYAAGFITGGLVVAIAINIAARHILRK